MSRKLTDFGVKASLLVFSINILQFVHLICLLPRLPPHFILKYLSTEHKTGVGTMGGLEFSLRIMGRVEDVLCTCSQFAWSAKSLDHIVADVPQVWMTSDLNAHIFVPGCLTVYNGNILMCDGFCTCITFEFLYTRVCTPSTDIVFFQQPLQIWL